MPQRVVKDFTGVNDALRELYAFLDYYTTKNLDFHRRRITNAHPSIDLYDYVVRKELIDTTGAAISQPPLRRLVASVGAYDKITFGIGVGSSVEVANNVTPPYVWSNKTNGQAAISFILANTPPVGSNLVVDLLKNDVTFATVTLPAGTVERTPVTSTTFIDGTFIRGDVITANVTAVGSTTAGQDITIVVFCTLS